MSNFEERDNFLLSVKEWEEHYGCKIKDRPERGRIFSDLKQARSMLLNALPNAFHYLHDARIAKTTNLAEGYFSFIKTVIVIIAGFLLENVKHFLTGSFFWKNEKIAHIFCHYTRSDKYEGRRYFPSVDMTIYVQDTILESISGGLKWPQLPLPRMIEKTQRCVECSVCKQARKQQSGFPFWFVKNIENGICFYCTTYEKVYGKKAYEA